MKKLLALAALMMLTAQPALAKHPGGEGHGHRGNSDQSELPPGLRKKDRLPPGWERKLNRGDRLDDDLYSHAVPLTRVEVARLPPPPTGIIQLRIDDKIIQLEKATRRIHDILHLP